MINLNEGDMHIVIETETDVIRIFGIAYAGALFRELAFAPIGTVLQIIQREDGCITIRMPSQPIWTLSTKEARAALPEGTWCWVTDGKEIWPMIYDSLSAGDWTNDDCEQDFFNRITHFMPLDMPSLPT